MYTLLDITFIKICTLYDVQPNVWGILMIHKNQMCHTPFVRL